MVCCPRKALQGFQVAVFVCYSPYDLIFFLLFTNWVHNLLVSIFLNLLELFQFFPNLFFSFAEVNIHFENKEFSMNFRSVPPSRSCGPFRVYNNMYDILTITVELWPLTASMIVRFLSSSAFILTIIVILM